MPTPAHAILPLNPCACNAVPVCTSGAVRVRDRHHIISCACRALYLQGIIYSLHKQHSASPSSAPLPANAVCVAQHLHFSNVWRCYLACSFLHSSYVTSVAFPDILGTFLRVTATHVHACHLRHLRSKSFGNFHSDDDLAFSISALLQLKRDVFSCRIVRLVAYLQ